MTAWMGRVWCRLVLVAVVFTVGAGAAQAMQLTPAQKTEMKGHYDKATRAYDIQKYTEAVEEYQKAYEIGGDPAMLYNVAQSYRLNDQLPDAIRFYRRYLQRSPNARNREDVERKISELEKTVEERRKAVASMAVPPPPVVPVSGTPATNLPPPTPAVEDGSHGRLVAGIVVASIGAAGLITFGITGKLAKDKSDQVSAASQQGGVVWDSGKQTLQDDGQRLNTIAVVSAIVGGAALVAGGILILTALPGSSGEHQTSFVTPVVGPGIMGAATTVRF